MGPTLWLGIVLFSWSIYIIIMVFSSPLVLKVPPLPPLNFLPAIWQW